MTTTKVSLLTSDSAKERALVTWLLKREAFLVEMSSKDWRLFLKVLRLMEESDAKPVLGGILSAMRLPLAIGKLKRSCASVAPLMEVAIAGKVDIEMVDARDEVVVAAVRPRLASSEE